MSRCDYDSIFYRVFSVTLLAIAFTFTVILTNVFIDIDGILSKKDHGKTEKPKDTVTLRTETVSTDNEAVYQGDQMEMRTEMVFRAEEVEEKADLFGFKPEKEDDEENYRIKRSLDSQKFQFHVRSPKIKEVLNKKLATLLEELDAEESHATLLKNAEDQKSADNQSEKQNDLDKITAVKPHDEMLHLAMHNILLQGILGHMDLSEVYKKVHDLVKKFNRSDKKTGGVFGNVAAGDLVTSAIGQLLTDKFQKPFSQEVMSPHSPTSVETKFFEELLKCEELQKQLDSATEVKLVNTRRSNAEITDKKVEDHLKVPKVLIRTVIDIKTLKNLNDSKSYLNSNNIKGLIKLIYNGKPIEFSPMKENEIIEEDQTKSTPESKVDMEKLSEYMEEDSGKLVNTFIDKALTEYLKKYPKLESKFKNKRLKRQVKHSNPETDEKSEKEKEEEEIYVQIETHFDGKGIKGSKKKKLIRQLVEKISKAIHSQMDSFHKTKKAGKETVMQIKKRQQNPLKAKLTEAALINKIVLRESQPISKIMKSSQQMNQIRDISNTNGPNVGKIYHGTGFLSGTKSINSGEMGTVNLQFDKLIEESGIPQRLQKPLNTDNINEKSDYDNLFNLGDFKFYVKETDDGNGFSIGFNQYVAEVPNAESMKVYSGPQQLIYDVNKKYDADNAYTNDQKEGQENINSVDNIEITHELRKRDVQQYKIKNNGAKDYHYNEYKVVFDNNYQPYDSYSQVFEDVDKKVTLSIVKDPTSDSKHPSMKNDALLPLTIDGNLFTKQLNPSEIFSLANLLDRKKRSTKRIEIYSKLKPQSKLHRYYKTTKMGNNNKNKLGNNRKRHKRQVDKIRILASDSLPRNTRRNDDENLFIVSDDDNMFADRAVVRDQERERETEDIEQDTEQEEHHEYVMPTKVYEDHYNPYNFNLFSTRARQNKLMSKYPHLFLDEMPQSMEENSNSFYSKLLNSYSEPINGNPQNLPLIMQSSSDPMIVNRVMNLEEPTKPNYKLTVKIIPKNSTDDAGFKEIHTSINKSLHRNGLIYSSQLNVSELSKVENLNTNPKTSNLNTNSKSSVMVPFAYAGDMDGNHTSISETSKSYIPLVQHIKEQQERMKELLKKHKQRIDDQLNTLKREKLNLDSIIVPDEKKLETIDVLLPLNPPQMLRLNKNEAGELISKALMKLHNAPQLNDILTNNLTPKNMTVTIPEVTTAHPITTTTTRITTTTKDPEKERILETIQRNENLTSAILSKIDRNTNLLQTFLQNLAERMARPPMLPATIAPTHAYPIPEQRPVKGPTYESVYNIRPHLNEPFIAQAIPNFELRKNGTHVSIPFVYAYQQPYPSNKQTDNVANIIYQGHIHTNAYNNIEANKLPTGKGDLNRTRFFMDERPDDNLLLKIVPLTSGKKTYDISRVKNNTTQSFQH